VQLTSTLGGMFTPRWTPAGDGFLATSFSNLSFNVYHFPVRELRPLPSLPPPATTVLAAVPAPAAAPPERNAWLRQGSGHSFPKKDYDTKFALDFVQGGVAYDPDFASAAGAQIGFTDVLGNHRFGLLFSTSSEGVDDFFRHLNIGVSYTNLTRRLNYTLGAFHFTRVYDPSLDMMRFERRVGGLLGVSYPLSRFERLESSVGALQLDDDVAGLSASAPRRS
jgi:hypothetical protein